MEGRTTIEAVAYEPAPNVITSEEIEEQLIPTLQRLNMVPGQLQKLTGIRERRFNDTGKMPSDAATSAARKALEMVDIDPAEIGCLINTSVCRDYWEPSVASLVQGNLDLPSNCISFDISNACVAFVTAIEVISLMIEARQIKYGLIVDGECSRDVVQNTINLLKREETTAEDYFQNFATLTLGSGAAAMIIADKDLSRFGHQINNSVSLSATEHSRLCMGDNSGMISDPVSLLKHGVELCHATWQKATEEIKNWSDETIDIYIPHQVGSRNMAAFNKALHITPEKNQKTYDQLGNVGPASIPITLARAIEKNKIEKEDHVAFIGIGSGLNCTMMSVTW